MRNMMMVAVTRKMAQVVSVLALTAASALCAAAFAEEAKPASAAADPAKASAEPAKGEVKAAKADPAKAQQIVTTVCAACHGADGNSTSPANPKLAAQHPDYLAKQLHNFKPDGGKPAERANPVMSAFAGPLSDDDIRNLSAFYSGQKLKPASAKLKDSVELGQKIYRGGIAEKGVPACAGCHSPNGAGIPAQFPRLAGQYADYTEAQLISFRGATRKNAPMMMAISARLSDAEIKAVSDYVAGLR